MGDVGAYLEKPHLQQVQATPFKGMIQLSSLSNSDVAEPEHDNQKELERLRTEELWLGRAYAAAIGLEVTSLLTPEPVTKTGSFLAGVIGTNLALQRLQKVSSITRNGDALDEAFGDHQIQIFADLDVPDAGRLDLFLKFPLPPKAVFAIALRSQGKGKVFYDEAEEALYVRRKGGRLRKWTPDHIERLGVQGFWLRQNRQELFGTSVRDRNRPLVKLLVLTGETKLREHPEHLYAQVGDEKVLLIQRQSSIYVLEETQLVGFIKGWLASKGK